MSHDPLSRPRLHSLIGDAMHDLPRDFAVKLERMLESNGMPLPSQEQTAQLAAEQMQREWESTRTAHRDDVAAALRMLTALNTTLETLLRAHASPRYPTESWLSDKHLMEGLLLASQTLALSAERTLRGDR